MVRLAIDSLVAVKNRIVGIHDTRETEQYDDFIVIELNEYFYVILALPWHRRYEPWIIWQKQRKVFAAY